MKKLLALMLSVAMMFTVGTSVMAYSDVEEGTYVSEAVTVLSGLDTLQGFEDDMFKPEENVTRAQMAAIVCRMLGYEEQAQASKGTTVFTDVAGNHWASGYVNVAYAQGIINGYGNGIFGPEDSVTYEQAIKMIVSALGYDLAATRKGGYPTGYLAIASAEGITKKANGTVGKAAKRGTIAILVYNALEVNLMDQLAWSSDGNDTYTKTNETILSKYLEVDKYEGIVTGTPITEIADAGQYDADITPMITIDDESYVCGNINADAYLGKSVIAYIGEDKVTNKKTVYSIAENGTKNDSFAISATQLVEEDERYWDVENVIGYKNVGSSKILDIELDDEVIAYKNYDEIDAPVTTEELAGLIRKGGSIEFISNDADSKYEVIVILAYDNEAVIENVTKYGRVYRYDLYTGSGISRIDTDDEDSCVLVIKDGEVATVADIKKNNTVSHIEIADDFDIYFVSSATVAGIVESYEDNIVTINNKDYAISKAYGETASRLSGEEGMFFLNVDGQIAYNETAPTATGNYALVVASYTENNGLNNGEYLQVVLTDGTVAEYKINTTAKLYDADGEKIDTDIQTYFEDMMTGEKTDSDAVFATANDLLTYKNLMVKLTVSNNKITKVRLLEGASKTANSTDKFDEEAMSIGRLDIAKNTVIFSIAQTDEEIIEPEDIVIGTATDFFVDGEEIGGALRAYDEDDNSAIFAAAVGFGLEKAIDSTSKLFIVTSIKTTIIDDNEAYIVTGIQNGEEIKITLYNEDEAIEAPAKGDIILLAEANAEGYVTEIEVLFDGEERIASNAKVKDEIYSGYGKVVKSAKNKFAIDDEIANDADASDVIIAAGDDISYRAAAIYTLLDYTENAKDPEVSIETGSEWLFDVEEYVSYAYVRYVDGRLAEVVVYRMETIED